MAEDGDATFTTSSVFPCSARELYEWHRRSGALERLIPPWERSRVLARSGGIEPGARVLMRMHVGPFPCHWQARHVEDIPGRMFRDIQESGPFARWTHTHTFCDVPGQGVLLEDRVDYAPPARNLLPVWVGDWITRSLNRVFSFRHTRLRDDLLLHRSCGLPPLRVLVSGASGLIGQALLPLLRTGGHEVWTLVRRPADRSRQEIYWNPAGDDLNLSGLPPFGAVIHLAGYNICQGWWTEARKRLIVESRVQGTGLLARRLAALPRRPSVLVSASAVGFYGDCQDRLVSEEAPAGEDFISGVCSRWEEAARPAQEAGIRTVFPRFGVVLSPGGGALRSFLSVSLAGLPRRLGTGSQYISWIGLDDALAALLHAISCTSLSGPVNVVAPEPARNTELLRTLARVLQRPLLPPLPASPLRLLWGRMAEEVLLGGCRVECGKLLASGFIFRHPRLEPALRFLLGRFDDHGPDGDSAL